MRDFAPSEKNTFAENTMQKKTPRGVFPRAFSGFYRPLRASRMTFYQTYFTTMRKAFPSFSARTR